MQRTRRSQTGFTLTEMLAVVLMISVMGGVIFAVFVTNWEALEDQIVRSDLWHEANEIVDAVTADGRAAKSIQVEASNAQGDNTAVFTGINGEVFATYRITLDGRLLVERAAGSRTISDKVDAANSAFVRDDDTGRGLRLMLTLTDDLLRRSVSINTATEIFPRNANSPDTGAAN
ncbi:MAG: prepilin-type N-terminal cleavage/methylation domain-containing protein [Candidatus Omnitrophica bacterium]|nr:prepilin-type N-terminal cleavage/methylation domain-containing protein [Candidatus Omnitrophota bacterium]